MLGLDSVVNTEDVTLPEAVVLAVAFVGTVMTVEYGTAAIVTVAFVVTGIAVRSVPEIVGETGMVVVIGTTLVIGMSVMMV